MQNEVIKNVTMTADLWRQLFHDKPIKFRLASANEFLPGTLDVVCDPKGECHLSIFYCGSNRVLGLPESRKIELTQSMFEKVGWVAAEDCFRAIFDECRHEAAAGFSP